MTKYIILNGPKKSGKDTIGQALHAKLTMRGIKSRKDKFAAPLKKAVGAFFELDEDMAKHYFEHPEAKDYPSHIFKGLTPRQALISFSEDWAKPKFGRDIFGHLLLMRNDGDDGCVVITDCGFSEELDPLDKTDVAVVRLHRHNTNFNGDSRGYIHRDDILCFDVRNEYEPDFVAGAILYNLNKQGFIKTEGDM